MSQTANKPTPVQSQVASGSSATPARAKAAAGAPQSQEFRIRAPKIAGKSYHFMRFNGTHSVDFSKWVNVKLERENNLREFRTNDEEMPKFGAGSEYNREQREELRRKKYGIRAAKYNPEAQPWILKVGSGKSAKKFKGVREGGVGENSAFYVFTHSPDGGIDAFPLKEWYNFQPIQRYKTLTAEEAEAEFGKQTAKQNFWSLMLRKRMRGDEEEQEAEDAAVATGSRSKGKELKITEMDEWIDSDEDSDSDEDGEKRKAAESDEDGARKGKNKNTKKKVQQKKKKKDVDSEAFEESDDGDNEGLEMDYDTSSSDDDSDLESKQVRELKGVAEEDALRKLLNSDDEEDEENKDKPEESENEDDEVEKDEVQKDKKGKAASAKDDKNGSSSDFSLNSSDSEIEDSKKKLSKVNQLKPNIESMSRPTTPISETGKRKLNVQMSEISSSDNSNSISSPAKRYKEEIAASMPTNFCGVVTSGSKADDCGITEEAVRRYLKRKPITAKDLLTKFKNKRSGVTSGQLVESMTKILKKIDPQKKTISGLLYLSLK